MGASVIRDLGPCAVYWDADSGTPIALNPTLGGVEFKYSVKTKDIQEDGQGEAAVDSITIGAEAELTVPMTRSAIAQLVQAIKGAALVGTSAMHVSNDVGTALYSLSKVVRVKPMASNVAGVTESEWLTIYKAYPIAGLDWKWDNSSQRTTKVVFKCFPACESAVVGKIFRVGSITGA
jgi:hypothetical protein